MADKGYHTAAALAACAAWGLRTYIPERRERGHRRWTDKPIAWKPAFRANRRRTRGRRSRALQRRRSERVERSFAHTCGVSGHQRRTWLRGVENVQKRYLLTTAARNLGLLMRHCFGIGTPRSLQGLAATVMTLVTGLLALLRPLLHAGRRWVRRSGVLSLVSPLASSASLPIGTRPSSTGC